MRRDAFLAQIRQSLHTAQLPAALANLPPRHALPPVDPTDLIEIFTREATALSATVHQAESDSAATEIILTLFAQYTGESYQNTEQNYLAWPDLPLPNLIDSLAAQGKTLRPSHLPATQTERQPILAHLATAMIGITGVRGVLADTGSIIVSSGQGQGRLTSLLPPVHIALVKVSQLYPSMAHFLRAHPTAVTGTSNLVFISGPSRTADIEQTLTLGVHGPKYLHIVLLP